MPPTVDELTDKIRKATEARNAADAKAKAKIRTLSAQRDQLIAEENAARIAAGLSDAEREALAAELEKETTE